MWNDESAGSKRPCWLFFGIIFSGWKLMKVHIDFNLQFKEQKKLFKRADLFTSFYSNSHELLYSKSVN